MSMSTESTKTPGSTEPKERPSPLRLILASRKGLVFIVLIALIGIAAVGFIGLTLHEAWAGRMTITAAMNQVFGTIIGAVVSATIAAVKLMDTFKDEDVAKINATAPRTPVNQQVNAPNAQVVDASMSDHAPTPAETPQAKRDSAAPDTGSSPSGHST
jgi:hypothetical protein